MIIQLVYYDVISVSGRKCMKALWVFNWGLFYTECYAHLKSHRVTPKMPDVKYLPLICLIWVSWRPPKQYRLLPLLLVAIKNFMARPSCWRYHTFWMWNMRNQVLLTKMSHPCWLYFIAPKMHSGYWMKKVTNSLIQW